MRRLQIDLTDDEFTALGNRALAERRAVKAQAAWYVAQALAGVVPRIEVPEDDDEEEDDTDWRIAEITGLRAAIERKDADIQRLRQNLKSLLESWMAVDREADGTDRYFCHFCGATVTDTEGTPTVAHGPKCPATRIDQLVMGRGDVDDL